MGLVAAASAAHDTGGPDVQTLRCSDYNRGLLIVLILPRTAARPFSPLGPPRICLTCDDRLQSEEGYTLKQPGHHGLQHEK